jgi:hypothetical protein
VERLNILLAKIQLWWIALHSAIKLWTIRVVSIGFISLLVYTLLQSTKNYKASNALIFWVIAEGIWQLYYKRTLKAEGRMGVEYAAVVIARIVFVALFVMSGCLGL